MLSRLSDNQSALRRARSKILLAATVVFALGGLGPNMTLALLSALVFAIGTILLWRPGEPPILAFAFLFAWLQASIAIFHSNWLGVDVTSFASFQGDMHASILLTLAGLLALAAGMRYGACSLRVQQIILAREAAQKLSLGTWFYVYCGASAIAVVALACAWAVPGLAQLLLAVVAMKWVLFFIGLCCISSAFRHNALSCCAIRSRTFNGDWRVLLRLQS